MLEQKRKNAFKDDLDGDYIGNVFGWKISIIGLLVIASFIGLYFLLSKKNQNQVKSNDHTIQEGHTTVSDADTLNLQ